MLRPTDVLLEARSNDSGFSCRLVTFPDGKLLAFGLVEAKLASEARKTLAAAKSLSACPELATAIGKMAFPGEIGDHIRALAAAGPLRLRVDADEDLSSIPWEAAQLDRGGTPLALTSHVKVVRHIERATSQAAAGRHLRVLIAVADPRSARLGTLLEADKELRSVTEALRAPECKGLIVDVLANASPNALGKWLAEPYDILHYIGHAEHRPTGGALVLEGGKAHEESAVYAPELLGWLNGAGVKLVTLASCSSAGAAASVGAELARGGIDAVLGMQFPIGDMSGLLFSRALYASLAEGSSLEDAVAQGRYALGGSGWDWAAPVLTAARPEGAPLRSRSPREGLVRGNLPKPLTSFIGRDSQIRSGVELLREHGLVTLLGSGGIGKTRLSIEVAREASIEFEHGAWQVLLEALTQDSQVIEAIAAVLGIRESSEKPVEQRLFEFLGDRNLLLVLDNCEHLVEGCRSAAQRILQACPEVRVLATSRTVLGVTGEHIVAVPALSYPLPPDDEEEPWDLPLPDTIEKFEALLLFNHRANEARAGFAVDDQSIESLCRIAIRLDGIPLAIELAASRVRAFSLKQIQEKLLQSLNWLDIESPANVPRHKTLRAALEWSYRLLNENERVLFSRLGVFVGTFSLEAAEHVAGFEPLTAEAVIDTLVSLVDNSLVLADEIAGEMRYRLLDTCRHFALEQASQVGELDRVRELHMQFMAEFLERTDLEFKIGDQVTARRHLEADKANLRAALDLATESPASLGRATKMANDLFAFAFVSGEFREALRVTKRVLGALSPEATEDQIVMRLNAGALAVYSGDSSGLVLLQEAYKMSLSSREVMRLNAAHYLGDCAYMLGQDTVALDCFDFILKNWERIGDPQGERHIRLAMASLQIGKQDYSHAEENLTLLSLANDPIRRGTALCTLGYLHTKIGLDDAQSFYAAGLKDFLEVNARYFIASYLVLSSAIFIPTKPRIASNLQGLADRLQEEAGGVPDRFVRQWGLEILEQSRCNPDHEMWFKDGRSLGVAEAVQFVDAGP